MKTKTKKTKTVRRSETGARSEIRYGIGLSALGAVLVARTPRGVCAILLGDSARDVEREVRERFPGAASGASDPELTALVASSVSLVERPGSALRAGARPRRHGVPAEGLAGAPRGAGGLDDHVLRARGEAGRASVRARRRRRVRRQSHRGRRSVPPRPADGRLALRLPVGASPQARAARARAGAGGMSAAHGRPSAACRERTRRPARGSRGIDWTRAEEELDAVGMRRPRQSPLRGRMPRDRGDVRRRRALPQPRRDEPARVRARRVQVLRPSAAAAGPRAASRSSIRASRASPTAGARRCASRCDSRRRTRSSSSDAARPVRRGRRRFSCATGPATTTACTRTSTARTCFRSRSRSCSPSRARTSPAGSSS